MAPRQLVEQADRAQTGGRPQHRDSLLVPQARKWIGAGVISPPLLLGARHSALGAWPLALGGRGSFSVRRLLETDSPALAADVI